MRQIQYSFVSERGMVWKDVTKQESIRLKSMFCKKPRYNSLRIDGTETIMAKLYVNQIMSKGCINF